MEKNVDYPIQRFTGQQQVSAIVPTAPYTDLPLDDSPYLVAHIAGVPYCWPQRAVTSDEKQEVVKFGEWIKNPEVQAVVAEWRAR